MDHGHRSAVERSIRTVIASWFRAMQEGDVAELLSLVTTDVIVKAPGSPPLVGAPALRQALTGFFAANAETVEFEVEEVEVSGSLAFTRVVERTTIRPHSGGRPSTVRGLHLTILRLQPRGNWLIARDFSSLIDA